MLLRPPRLHEDSVRASSGMEMDTPLFVTAAAAGLWHSMGQKGGTQALTDPPADQ